MKKFRTWLAITIALMACSAPAAVGNSNATDSGMVSNAQRQANGDVLEVTVLAKENQKIIPNASVIIYREGNQTSGITASNGVALLRVPPGQFSVIVTKEGWGQTQLASTMVAGQINRVRIGLDPALRIGGTVRDPSGAAVAGALVAVFPKYNGGNNEAKTDASGHYETTWQRPAWQGMENQKFFLIARSIERNLALMREVDEKTTNLDLSLKPGLTVSARVEDPKSKPIPNVTGYIMVVAENYSFSLSGQPIRSDNLGHIEIRGLPPGVRYGLNIYGNGYGSANKQMAATDANVDHYEFPPIVLKIADRQLAGRVLGTDGKPAAGIQVSIQNTYNEGQPQGFARTDANGHFVFSAVCEGPVSLWANSQNGSANTRANGGDTNVVIRLGSNNITYAANTTSLTITGTVFQASGKPAIGTKVIVSPQSGRWNEAITDEKGQFTLNWQPVRASSNPKFFLIARDMDHNLAAVEEVNEQTTAMDLHLKQGFTVSGTVQEDITGNPINLAAVNLNFMAGNMGGLLDSKTIQTDAQGHFAIAALPVGERYSLRVTARDYGTATKQLSQAETQKGDVVLPSFQLKPANLPLAGQVLDSDNNPASGAMILLNGQGQPNGNTRADSTGHFNFKVSEGPVTVLAFSPQGGTARATVQTRGGDTNVVLKMNVQQTPNATVRSTPFRPRTAPLKEQPWTLRTIMHWPATHKTATTVLLCIQGAILAGTAGGIYWFARKHRP